MLQNTLEIKIIVCSAPNRGSSGTTNVCIDLWTDPTEAHKLALSYKTALVFIAAATVYIR